MGDWALAREGTLKTPIKEATTQMKKATAQEVIVRFALRPVGTRRETVTSAAGGTYGYRLQDLCLAHHGFALPADFSGDLEWIPPHQLRPEQLY